MIQSQDEWMTQRESHVWINETNPIDYAKWEGRAFKRPMRTFGNHAIEVGEEMWEASRSKKPLVRHLGAAIGHWPFGNARFPRIMFALPVWRGCCFLCLPCPHPAGRPCSGVSLSRDKGRNAEVQMRAEEVREDWLRERRSTFFLAKKADQERLSDWGQRGRARAAEKAVWESDPEQIFWEICF